MTSIYENVIILDSTNATSVSLSAGKASYLLKEPIYYQEARRVDIAVNTFSFTNFFLNISSAIGNNVLYYSDDALDETQYSITIPDGSYSIDSLSTKVVNLINDDGHVTDLFTIVGDYALNKAYLLFGTPTGWYVHYGSDSPFAVLGGANGDNLPASQSNTAAEVVYNTNTADFNSVKSINLRTNLSSNLIFGTNRSDIIYTTLPIVSVGSTQQDQPPNLMWISADSLRNGVSQIDIQIEDQNQNALSMSESFYLVLVTRVS